VITHPPWRPATTHERAAIIRAVDEVWHGADFAAMRRVRLHPSVGQIRLSRRDRHFASAVVFPLDAHGKQPSETEEWALLLLDGRWTEVAAGTDLSSICSRASPAAFRDVFCR
jgi:hypothetical protein